MTRKQTVSNIGGLDSEQGKGGAGGYEVSGGTYVFFGDKRGQEEVGADEYEGTEVRWRCSGMMDRLSAGNVYKGEW